jgi:hypothetical protein
VAVRSRVALTVATAVAVAATLAAGGGCGSVDPVPPRNRPPFVDGLFVTPPQPSAGLTAVLNALVRDDDPEGLVVAWEVQAGELATDGFGATWRTPDTGGAYRVIFRATDAAGARVEMTLYVPVLAPPPPPEPGDTPPVITSILAEPGAVNAGEVATLTVVATDADGDPLTYAWLTPPGDLMDAAAPVAAYVAFEGACIPGYYQFSVHVDDGRGGFDEAATSVWIDPNP